MGNVVQTEKQLFSALNRSTMLQAASEETMDLLVIGGGITGAGIALDAAARGLKVALVDMQDFAAGTSSRSTKLVHGGLRYLKQLEIGVVAEVGKERTIVYENGPHVTTPEWMLLPMYKGGTFGPITTALGLSVYDFLAGVKKTERRKMLSKEETLRKEPLLKKEGMKGGGFYVEYRTDDARLTIEVLKKAVELGVTAINYGKVSSLRYGDDGQLIGVVVEDMIDHQTYNWTATKVVNATGPWVDEIRDMDHSKQGKTLRLTKGVHLVFSNERFPLQQSIYFDTADGRMVFAIPRDGKTYIGTTDTDYNGNIAHPVMSKDDQTYLLAAANFMFPSLQLSERDVESSWAGLRPLIHQEGKDPSEISRRDEIFVSNSGLVSIAGGKLTGYRKMAETVVDKVIAMMQQEGLAVSAYKPCSTRHMSISGGDVGGSVQFPVYIAEKTKVGQKIGFTEAEARFLVTRYGSNIDMIYALAEQAKLWGASFGLPARLSVQLYYSIHQEMTMKPADFFIRRTGDLFFDIAKVHQWKGKIVEAMGQTLDWTDEQRASYIAELEQALRDAVGT
ncbi:glycerol-3-phosphate dehydrogenase/oxidase [Paenibacillus yanchengensis]|uniref:Glycerol-3-phosphate dehydrogenase n=1 Tax=Paenibacillus yanchengensis TaxID=2035833 RepID=A0ABW4YPB4_9BACL